MLTSLHRGLRKRTRDSLCRVMSANQFVSMTQKEEAGEGRGWDTSHVIRGQRSVLRAKKFAFDTQVDPLNFFLLDLGIASQHHGRILASE